MIRKVVGFICWPLAIAFVVTGALMLSINIVDGIFRLLTGTFLAIAGTWFIVVRERF